MHLKRTLILVSAALLISGASTGIARSQEPDGPQTSAPPPAPRSVQPAARNAGPPQPINVPAGTRFAVVLENGISTRGQNPAIPFISARPSRSPRTTTS